MNFSFDELNAQPMSFNDEIARYVRESMCKTVVATMDGAWDALIHYSDIALSIDRMCKFDLVGSVEIIGSGNDYDILICSSSATARHEIEEAMRTQGFFEEGDGYPQDEFTSLRFNEVNVLVTDNQVFFDKWLRSVAVCKLVRDEFGGCDRPLRVAIHQAIMDGEAA